MAKYLVGDTNDTWDFYEAYSACNPGDTIELKEDYYLYLDNEYFSINKDITIEGHIKTQDNTNYYSNKIIGRLDITNGSNVYINNLWLEINNKNSNIININQNSTLSLYTVVIDQTDNVKIESNDDKYPEVYVKQKSNLIMNHVYTFDKKDMYSEIYVTDSILEINNSKLHAKLSLDSSKSKITNSGIVKYYVNTLNIEKSNLEIENSTIEGGDASKDYPCVYAEESVINSNKNTIIQKNYSGAMYLGRNCYLDSYEDKISSINLSESRAYLSNIAIKEVISIYNKSYMIIKDIDIYGENPDKIDIYVDGYSTFRAKSLNLNRVVNPNIRVNDNSVLLVDNISLNYSSNYEDTEKINIDSSEDSNYIINSLNEEDGYVGNAGEDKKDEKDEKDKKDLAEDPYNELNKLVGLNSVKNEINKMIRLVEFNEKRISQGLSPEENSLHSVFMGNPGTGKTTVARLIGQILFENKALYNKEEFIFVEATESDLISSYVGRTAEQTQELLEKANGGILFIDEAYTLNKGDSSVNFGQEAINTILKYMEDHRNEIMIIFAGYTKEMEQFLETNPGLKSRVPNKFIFEDYTGEEIVQIGEDILIEKQYVLEDRDYYRKNVSFAYEESLDRSNGRWIRNFNEKLLRVLASRVIESNSSDVSTITNEDIDEVFNIGKYQNYNDNNEDAYESLNKLIGINKVKEQVNEFISLAELNKRRMEQGRPNQNFTLHSIFLGNPGTGKTTVARILGNLLYQKSIIKENKFIEVSRSDLVAGYTGQTAIKTRKVLKSALGGVLFIDEAYSLTQGAGDFGSEAIDEILKFMEDHRDNIVIIFAGYDKEMQEFLSSNSGLRSRVPNEFDFEDYSIDELVKIGLMSLDKFGYSVNRDLYYEVVYNNYHKTNDNSNGRWIRNLNERLIGAMSQRVSKYKLEDVNTITDEDLEMIKEQ